MPLPFDIGKRYTFNTLAPAMLGTVIENAKLVSIMDYENIVKQENFIKNTYANILPLLANGTPTDPRSSIYYIFETLSGDRKVLSQYWVDEGTIEEIQLINFKVTVTDSSLGKMTTVRNLLNSAGITNFNIEQI